MNTWLPILLFTALWADLVRQLGYHWSTNPQYAFGWSVPVLSLFLLWEAWITRPSPSALSKNRWLWAIVAICAFCLLPARLFFEATPDWRFPLWVTTGAVIGLSLCAISFCGGWSWLKHFAFPTAFILVAVPWPVKFEQPVIQALTDLVAVMTVHGLNMCGIPAINRGNLIEISTGVVGIEEACSGIRSFQAALMVSLFLGQLFAFQWRLRFLLIGIAAIVAFVSNAFRAGFLTFIADTRGIPAIARWHDSAGYTILFVCFAILTGIALFLRPTVVATPSRGAVSKPRFLPKAFTYALSAWMLFAVIGTEVWYRTGTRIQATWWRVEWPLNRTGYSEIQLTEEIRAMQSDEAKAARWKENDGKQFTMFFFRWLPGPATTRMLARFHRPEICLPAIGTKLVRESAVETLQTGDIQLVFRTYLFEQNGNPIYVFFCVWEDEKPANADLRVIESWTPETRLQAVLMRKRKLGQQVLEVAIIGKQTDEEARAEFRHVVIPMIYPDAQPPKILR